MRLYTGSSKPVAAGPYTVDLIQGDNQILLNFTLIRPVITLEVPESTISPNLVTVTGSITDTFGAPKDFLMSVGWHPSPGQSVPTGYHVWTASIHPNGQGEFSITLPKESLPLLGAYDIVAFYRGLHFSTRMDYLDNNGGPGGGWGCHVPPGNCNPDTDEPDTVRTPSGEEIPVIPVFDEDGNKLPITFVEGPIMQLTENDKPPSCAVTQMGLFQEGVRWNPRLGGAVIGGSAKWTAPSDINGISSGEYGIWYNPVNFFYSFSGSSSPYYFQVDFGVANSFRINGWALTFFDFFENGTRRPHIEPLPIPFRTGATYLVDGFLRNVPNTTASEFIVQITLPGVHEWVAKYDLNWSFNSGWEYFKTFESFNDQYIIRGGTANENIGDYTSEFALIYPGEPRLRAYGEVPSLIPFDEPKPSQKWGTVDILSPSVDNSIVTNRNIADCRVWSD